MFQLLQSIVMSVLLFYGGVYWTNILPHYLFVMLKCLRRICGLSVMECVASVDISSVCDMTSMDSQLRRNRLR